MTTRTNRVAMLLLLVAAVLPFNRGAFGQTAEAPPPNIVFIMADNLPS